MLRADLFQNSHVISKAWEVILSVSMEGLSRPFQVSSSCPTAELQFVNNYFPWVFFYFIFLFFSFFLFLFLYFSFKAYLLLLVSLKTQKKKYIQMLNIL